MTGSTAQSLFYKAVLAATGDRKFPLTRLSGREYVACDNLYLNEHARIIYSYSSNREIIPLEMKKFQHFPEFPADAALSACGGGDSPKSVAENFPEGHEQHGL